MIAAEKFSKRHPELVSGSISPLGSSACGARWMLKRVQHDGVEVGNCPPSPSPLGRGWGGGSSLASTLGLTASLPHPLPLPAGEGGQVAGVLA